MSSRTRSLAFFAAKGLFAAALITWLVRSGVLDFRALAVMVRQPLLLVIDIGIFVLAILCAVYRWRLLLADSGVEVPLGRAIQLQLTAAFFNVVIPGSIGGDVLKALYAARDSAAEKRTNVFLVGFVERLLGLAALVLVAGIVVLFRADVLFRDPNLKRLATIVMLLSAATIAGPLGFLLFVHRMGDRLDKWTSGPSLFARLSNQLVAAARLLSRGPKSLVSGLGLSMAIHGASMLFFALLTPVITSQHVALSSIATVYPLGMLTLVLPISPSGLGVGHVAFDRLFETIGLHGGATVFNVFLLAQIAPNLIGVFPYLALKRSGELPMATATE